MTNNNGTFIITWRPESDGDYFQQKVTAYNRNEALEIWRLKWTLDPSLEYYGPYVNSEKDCAIFEVKQILEDI
jgi:hypothetical protein